MNQIGNECQKRNKSGNETRMSDKNVGEGGSVLRHKFPIHPTKTGVGEEPGDVVTVLAELDGVHVLGREVQLEVLDDQRRAAVPGLRGPGGAEVHVLLQRNVLCGLPRCGRRQCHASVWQTARCGFAPPIGGQGPPT